MEPNIAALLDEIGQPHTIAGVEAAARRFLAARRYDDVVAVAEAAPPRTPDSQGVRELEARAFLALGQADDAASMAWIAAEDGATAPLLALLEAAWVAKGDPAAAARIRRRRVALARPEELSPEDRALAEAELRSQGIEAEARRIQAASGAERALQYIEAHPGDAVRSPTLVRLRGWLLSALGYPDDAAACFGSAMSAYPDDPAMLAEYARTLVDSGQVDRALASGRLLIRPEQLPGVAGWLLLEAVYRRAGRLADAIAAVDRGLAVSGDRDLRGRRALLVYELGRPDEAEREAHAVLAEGRQAHAHAALGYVARDRGDAFVAVDAFTRAWHARPDEIAWVDEAARSAVALGDLDRARNLYRVALFERPRDASLHQRRVQLELDRGTAATAEAAAGEFVAATPQLPDAWLALATASRWRGDRSAALEAVREGLRLAPARDDLRRLAAELDCQIDGTSSPGRSS